MRVLVTGGAGFIGSHIVEELLRGGAAVRVLDNFSSGNRTNLASFQGDLEIQEGDLRDAGAVKAATRGVDLVFHLAAFISVPQSMLEPENCRIIQRWWYSRAYKCHDHRELLFIRNHKVSDRTPRRRDIQ